MAPASRWILAAALAALAALTASPAAQDSSSGRDDCPLSPELASVTGHILVKVTASEKGQVLWVKDLYSTIEPAKARKGVMKSLKSCLKKRHFKEAVVRDAVKVRTDFLLAYHYFEPISDDASTVEVAQDRRVPEAWLEEMRAEKARLAESLMAKSKRVEVAGAGWKLTTDVTREVIEDIRRGLETAEQVFNMAFPGAPPVPAASPVSIFVLTDDDKLNRVAAFDNMSQSVGGLLGQYDPIDRSIYTYAGLDTPPALVAGTIAHEATHHFVAQRLYPGDRSPPFWVTEGIAELVQCVDTSDPEGLHLDRFRTGKLFKGGWRWMAPAQENLNVLETSLRREDLRPLGLFLRGQAHGAISVRQAYAISWLLVHYLVNADEGAHRQAFLEWMSGPKAEDDHAISIAAALDVAVEDLETALRAHLDTML